MSKTKKITLTALLCAISYVAVFTGRIPISPVSFLKYDPKDAIVVMGGFILGPGAAFCISVIVSFLEMVTISETGIIGCLMNIVSTSGFALTASVIYKHKRTVFGAVISLLAGMFVMTALMLVWNYAVTPYYYGTPRSVVAKMLIPVFLPFNLIKSGLNTALTLFIYKPFVNVLGRSGLYVRNGDASLKINIVTIVAALLLMAASIAAIFILK